MVIRSIALTIVLASGLALGGVTSATSQAVQCKNGYPSWANDAFTNRRQGGFTCDPLPEKKPKTATKQRPRPEPKRDTDTAEKSRATETADADGQAAKAGTCRRYLASTGQTVEVPCAQ